MPRPEVLAEFHSAEFDSADSASAERASAGNDRAGHDRAGNDRAGRHGAASVFGLRAPASATRREHWRQVLRWYGVEGGRPYPVPATLADPERHVLVCLDPALRPTVASYARLLGGRPVTGPSDCDPAGWASVTLVGLPDRLGLAQVRHWVARSARGHGPPATIGVLTGRDREALDFLLAKQLALRLRPRPADGTLVCLDELHDEAVLVRDEADEADEESWPLSAPVVQKLLPLDADLLTVHAHGEGSHANLRHEVLCGQEAAFGDHGLSCGGDPPQCKRAGHCGGRFTRFQQLRAARLLFFSCNGFATAGELYAGGPSAALAMIDGYPAGVVCNDRPVPMSQAAVRASFALAASAGLLAVADLLNDAYPRQVPAVRPWLLVGDPALARPTALADPEGRGPESRGGPEGPGGPRQVQVLPKPEGVIRVQSTVPPTAVLATAGQVLVVGRGEHQITAEHDFEPRCAAIDDALRHAFFYETLAAAIADHARAATGRDPGQEPAWNQLRSATGQLRLGLSRAQRRMAAVALSGVAGPEADAVWPVCQKLSAAWGSTWAKALDGLLDGHLEESIMMVARDARQGREAVCARCGSGCRWADATDQAGLGVRLRWLTCPTCGLLDAICGPATGLDITVPATWRGSEELTISLAARASPAPRWLAVSLRDKGRGTQAFRRPLTTEIPATLAIAPPDLSPDLHTLHFLCVSGLGWSVHRRRVAYWPEPKEDR